MSHASEVSYSYPALPKNMFDYSSNYVHPPLHWPTSSFHDFLLFLFHLCHWITFSLFPVSTCVQTISTIYIPYNFPDLGWSLVNFLFYTFIATYIRPRVTSNIHLSVVVSATLFSLKKDKIVKKIHRVARGTRLCSDLNVCNIYYRETSCITDAFETRNICTASNQTQIYSIFQLSLLLYWNYVYCFVQTKKTCRPEKSNKVTGLRPLMQR